MHYGACNVITHIPKWSLFSCMHLNAIVLLNKLNVKVSMMLFSLQVQTVVMLPSVVSTKLQILGCMTYILLWCAYNCQNLI